MVTSTVEPDEALRLTLMPAARRRWKVFKVVVSLLACVHARLMGEIK